jgi:hypothetical protein
MPAGIGYDNPHQDALQKRLGGDIQPAYTMPVAGAPDLGARMPPPGGGATGATGGGVGDRDQLKWGNTGQMRGFEVGSDYGGDTKARNSVKNTFGRIASRYNHAPGSIDQIMQDADFKRFFPNATTVVGGANDQIDFGGVMSDFESGVPVGIVDVLEAADGNTSRGWQWLDEGNAGGGAGSVPAAGAVAGMTPGGGGQSDLMQQILAALQQQTDGTADPQALLMQQLGAR